MQASRNLLGRKRSSTQDWRNGASLDRTSAWKSAKRIAAIIAVLEAGKPCIHRATTGPAQASSEAHYELKPGIIPLRRT